MSSEYSISEIVNGEVELMKSAFADEFEDLRCNDPWKVPRPPEIRIKLGPHYSKGGTLHSHVSATIKIKTNEKYPHEAAEVVVESCNGLTIQESKILQDELSSLSVRCAEKATVVMMDVCQHTQNFLSNHARPYSESIYAEMVAGQKAKEQALQLEKEAELKKKWEEDEENRKVIKTEVDRVQEALKEEVRMRKESKKSGLTIEAKERLKTIELARSPKRWINRTVSECSAESSYSDSTASNYITFSTSGKQEKTLLVLESLGERADQNYYVDVGQDRNTQERCVVYSWHISKKREKKKGKLIRDQQMEDFINKLNVIEKEVNILLNLRSQKNLIAYKGFKLSNPNPDSYYIHLVQEFVQGLSLKYFLDKKIPISEAFLFHISSDVLEAINFLHQNNIVHRNLRDSCMFVDHATHCIRVADFGIERRFVEVIADFHNEEISSDYPQSFGRGGKKCDIFRFGIILLSFLTANRVNEVIPTLPPWLTPNMKSFLNRCLEIAEQDRWTSQQLLQHPFLCQGSGDRKLSIKELNKCASPGLDESDDDDKDTSIVFDLPSSCKELSRFTQEYNILEMLGKGGFGRVYKVRNKVDDCFYALKRIPLHHHSENVKRKMTREVKLLSSLNHENVVRYFTSWIESFSPSQDQADCKDDTSSDDDDNQTNFIDSANDENVNDWLLLSLRTLTTDSYRVWAADSESMLRFAPSHQVFVLSDTLGFVKYVSMMGEEDDSDDIVFVDSDISKKSESMSEKVVDSPTPLVKKLQYLNIQMEYCEKNTLRQAIDKNLSMNEERIWRLFIEMTSGLDYIHLQGLIHRDLKPGNVFLDSMDHVKIGDFGLATVGLKKDMTSSTVYSGGDIDKPDGSNLTSHVGTPFYIAPEITQVQGKVSYSNKVDIYSLGIIFFEMNFPLSTGMERVKTLSSLRHPDIKFLSGFDDKLTKRKKELIEWVLNHDPSKRPSTVELLKSDLVPPPTKEKQKFMTSLETKIQNERSQDYQDILNLLFKPFARPKLEETFEVGVPKLTRKKVFVYDLLRSLITRIFKSHGGIWMPSPFYIPKGSFYRDEENIVSLMSKGGELVTAQFELRYPFARFISRTDFKYLRRYSIDRVQRAHKTSGIHPAEIYECAFDIIASKQEMIESCARVILIGQEILLKISKMQPNQIMIQFSHYELVKIIFSYCGLEMNSKIISMLKEFRGTSNELEYFGEFLLDEGASDASVESLKEFLLINGSIEDVSYLLGSKIPSSRKQNLHSTLKKILSQIRDIAEVCTVMGVKFETSLHPMVVVDQNLYQGVTFRLIPLNCRQKSSFNILAQGGSYDSLIHNQRALASSKKNDPSFSAVGISLSLERIMASLDASKSITPMLELSLQFQGQSNLEGSPLLEIFICAIEQRELALRVDLCSKLKNENINADHGFVTSMAEAENLCDELWYTSHFLFLVSSDRIICRSFDKLSDNQNRRSNDKKITRSYLFDHLLKLCKPTKGSDYQSPTSFKRESIKVGGPIEKSQIRIEYVMRKQARNKDVAKIEQLITEDILGSSSRWAAVSADDYIEVLALDLDQKSVLCLGQLDVDSNARNFNESVIEIKARLPDIKDYIDRICNKLLNKIFYGKKNERPAVIVCYSIPSESFKRIV